MGICLDVVDGTASGEGLTVVDAGSVGVAAEISEDRDGSYASVTAGDAVGFGLKLGDGDGSKLGDGDVLGDGDTLDDGNNGNTLWDGDTLGICDMLGDGESEVSGV